MEQLHSETQCHEPSTFCSFSSFSLFFGKTQMSSSSSSSSETKEKMLLKAAHFACVRHEGQTRKNQKKSPYIVHPLHVASVLEEHGVWWVHFFTTR